MPRKEKKYHYIYKTTCKVTGRYYIGMHSTDNLEDGYLGSGKRLWNSLNHYGKENHFKEILEFLPDRSSLKRREKEIVTTELIGESQCMNLVIGGEGGFISLSGCTKGGIIASAIIKNRLKNDVEFAKKYKQTFIENVKKSHKAKKYNYNTFEGKRHSEDTKKLMSELKVGYGLGSTNSQYGTIWITNGSKNKKIKKEDRIPKDWYKGRI